MSLTIFYTPRSKETLLSVYNFIENRFGAHSAKVFFSKVDKTIQIISKQPYMFKAASIGEHVRIAHISKQLSLFYEVSEKSIILLFFWDNRQEPFL